MSDSRDIPILTDLIEPGPEITLSDLGLDNDPVVAADEPAPGLPQAEEITIDFDEAAAVTVAGEISPALEQAVRRILDEHMELAWQEIKLAIEEHQKR
jgi:hypothetical protein